MCNKNYLIASYRHFKDPLKKDLSEFFQQKK